MQMRLFINGHVKFPFRCGPCTRYLWSLIPAVLYSVRTWSRLWIWSWHCSWSSRPPTWTLSSASANASPPSSLPSDQSCRNEATRDRSPPLWRFARCARDGYKGQGNDKTWHSACRNFNNWFYSLIFKNVQIENYPMSISSFIPPIYVTYP